MCVTCTLVCVQHVFSIIDRKPAIDASSPAGDAPKECTGSIRLVDVTFAYPVRPEVSPQAACRPHPMRSPAWVGVCGGEGVGGWVSGMEFNSKHG